MCHLFKKNKSIIALVGISFLIPILLHIGYNYVQIIPTIPELPSGTWLLFLGSYLGGIATLIAVFISTKKAGEANRKMIERQWSEKKFMEYKQTLLSNLDLTSLPDLGYNLINLSPENITEKRNSIAQKKKDLYKCDVAFRISSSIDVANREHLKEELHYYRCWQCLTTKVSSVLDMQLSAIEMVQLYVNNNKILDSERQIIYNLEQIIKLSKEANKPCEDEEKQLLDRKNEVLKLQKEKDDFRPKFDNQLEVIMKTHSDFQTCVQNQYQLTLKLLDAKELSLTQLHV